MKLDLLAEVGMLLVPIMLLSITTSWVYKMCLELGISMIYAAFPPV